MSVDFRELNKQAVFKIMLTHDTIDFGFIPKWRRRAFLRFLKRHEIIRPYSDPATGWSWKVTKDFTYTVTYSGLDLPFNSVFEWWRDLTNRNEQHTLQLRATRNPRKPYKYDYAILNGDLIYG